MATNYTPQAIFDQADLLKKSDPPAHVPSNFHTNYQQATEFLLSYRYNDATFNSYRREIEKFCQWAWFIAGTPFAKIKREDIENYLLFCRKPPNDWIGVKNVMRFIEQDGKHIPNPEWRPFVVSMPKAQRKTVTADRAQYQLSEKGFREIFTILNGFYKFLIQEAYTEINPIAQIRQKNRFYRKQQGKAKIRRISDLQWQYVLETAEQLATQEPEKHERTLFIMSILYLMYLRISELVASDRWTPRMSDFEQDDDGNWWFTTVGKGNKERTIPVSDIMLAVLKRWRKYLQLPSALPTPNDNSPLVPKQRGHGSVTDTRYVRRLVQFCFDRAVEQLQKDGFEDDAEKLMQATVHWLRHTGISEDVKHRPREHVRDDAGHSSSAITDKYIDIDLHERHASAKNKQIKK